MQERHPVTSDDVLNAVSALRGDCSLTDFGISLSVWMARAVCSTHGPILAESVTNGEPPQDYYLTCVACLALGTRRRCPVVELERMNKPIPGL